MKGADFSMDSEGVLLMNPGERNSVVEEVLEGVVKISLAELAAEHFA